MTPGPKSAPIFAVGIVLTNAGLLAGLVFGPNLGHANAIVSWTGLAVMAVGLVLMAANAANRRRRISAVDVNVSQSKVV